MNDHSGPRSATAIVSPPAAAEIVHVRNAQQRDLAAVIDIDEASTGHRKAAYWEEILVRYGSGRRQQRFFLVAESAGRIDGYVIGEVRDWEFGFPRVGWVFAINVRSESRLAGTGSRLLDAICAGFRKLGVATVRTLLSRDNHLILSFFRSQGMMAAPFIPLEKRLDEGPV